MLRYDVNSVGGWISTGIARLEGLDPGGRAEIRRGMEMKPRSFEDRLFQGVGAFYRGSFEEAGSIFQELSGRAPRDPAIWFHLALSRHHAGASDDARVALAKVARLRPQDPWVTWLEAELLFSARRWDEARELLERSGQQLTGHPPLLLRAGALLHRLGETRRGQSWIDLARPRTEDGSIHWSETGRLLFPKRTLEGFGG